MMMMLMLTVTRSIHNSFIFHTHTRTHTHPYTVSVLLLLFCVYYYFLFIFFSLSFFCLFKTTQTFRGACLLQTKFPVQNFNFEFKRCGFCVFGHGAFRFTLLIYGANSYYSMATALSVASTKWDSWKWSSIKAANDDTSLIGSDLAKFSFFLLFTSDEWLFFFSMRFVTFGNFIYLIHFIHWNCNNSSNHTTFSLILILIAAWYFKFVSFHWHSIRCDVVWLISGWNENKYGFTWNLNRTICLLSFFLTNFFLITR